MLYRVYLSIISLYWYDITEILLKVCVKHHNVNPNPVNIYSRRSHAYIYTTLFSQQSNKTIRYPQNSRNVYGGWIVDYIFALDNA
jgi:hypothetical protein